MPTRKTKAVLTSFTERDFTALSGDPELVLGANSRRFALSLCTATSNAFGLGPTGNMDINRCTFVISGVISYLLIKYEDIGDAIKGEWFVLSFGGANPQYRVTEFFRLP